MIPLFIIDHFAKHDLEKRFGEIARLAALASASNLANIIKRQICAVQRSVWL